MTSLAGTALVALSALCFGLVPVFARVAYADGTGTTSLLFLRFATAGILLLALMRVRALPFPRGRSLLGFVLMGALGFTGQSFCYFTALKFTSANLVALILYAYPAFVTLLSVLVFGERFSAGRAVALLLSLSGSIIILGFGGEGDIRGLLLSLGAALIYSVYIIAGSRLVGAGMAIPSSTVIMLSAALVFGVISGIGGFEPPRSASGTLAVLAIALVSTVVAPLSFFAGMERVGPSSASMISTLEPLVTVASASVFLGERLGPTAAAGGGLILSALVLLALPARGKMRSAQEPGDPDPGAGRGSGPAERKAPPPRGEVARERGKSRPTVPR